MGRLILKVVLKKNNFGSSNLQIRKLQPTKAQQNPTSRWQGCTFVDPSTGWTAVFSFMWGHHGHTSHKPLWSHHTCKIQSAFQMSNHLIDVRQQLQLRSPALSFHCIWGPGGAPALPHHTAPWLEPHLPNTGLSPEHPNYSSNITSK